MRVLMIGNSYTFYHDLPALLQHCAQADLPGLSIQTCLRGGKNWAWHWEEGEARAQLAQAAWDTVILQDHSRGTLELFDEMQTYGRILKDAANDARVILYMTWAREYEPEKIDLIAERYEALACALGAEVAPVGRVWEACRIAHPTIKLHIEDESHPTPAGSYIALCVLYRTLTGKSPVGLPHSIPVPDKDNFQLAADLAKSLQQLSPC